MQRYALNFVDGSRLMQPADDGLWVRVEDALAVEAETARLEAQVEQAFRAGYHATWTGDAYTFDPALKPGDPNGAFAAWQRSLEPQP